MTTWYYFWKQAFSDTECDAIIAAAMDIQETEGTVGGGGTQHIDTRIRTSQIRWLQPTLFRELHTRIADSISTANRAAFNFDIDYLPPLQFTKYSGDDSGHYDWHIDGNFCLPNRARKLSCVLQLSHGTDYSGGDLQIDEMQPDAIELRSRGAMIVFPAFARHRVTPVRSGTRYSLVSWMEGPPFR